MKKITASPYSYLFWNEYKLNPDGYDYNMVYGQRISGDLNINRLETACTKLFEDHVLFGRHICEEEGVLYWVKNATIPTFQHFDGRNSYSEFIQAPIQLDKGPLYRVGLFKIDENTYDFVIVISHLLLGGASLEEFGNVLSQYYKGDYSYEWLSESEIHHANIAMQESVDELIDEGGERYWQEKVGSLDLSSAIPFENAQSVQVDVQAVKFTIAKSEWESLKQQSSLRRISPFFVFSQVWGSLIALCSGVESFCLGYPVAIKEGRSISLGSNVNSAVLPIDISHERSFKDLYNQNVSSFGKTYKKGKRRYNELPTINIAKASGIRNVDIAISQAVRRDIGLSIERCELQEMEDIHADIGSAKMIVEYMESETQFDFVIRFRSSLIDPKRAQSLPEYFSALLEQAMLNPDAPLSSHVLSPDHEIQRLNHFGSAGDETSPSLLSISQRFEQMAMEYPDNIALKDSQTSLSYKEVNERANQLAAEIRSLYFSSYGKPIEPDCKIAIFKEKSLQFLIDAVAILKAGAAYVPMAVGYPSERIQYILKDTRANMVLTDSESLVALSEASEHLEVSPYLLATDNTELGRLRSKDNLQPVAGGRDLGAIIYTSGTTGNPKGVMVEQHSIASLVVEPSIVDIESSDVFIFLSSPVFDVSSFEIWGALLNGATLVVPGNTREMASDVAGFKAMLHQYKVNMIATTTALFDHLYVSDNAVFNSLKFLMIGGEALTPSLMNQIANQSPRPDIIVNGYGPTEVTTVSTAYRIQPNETHKTLPIGGAILNRKLYVLNKQRTLVPEGVVGELYIGGAGLARGYLNREDLTQSSFLDNPYATEEDIALGFDKMYKTGDLVRWLPCGNLEYFGRNDSQVKIRGFRIELGEIEAAIAEIEGIAQAAVVDRDNDGVKVLAAYFTLEGKLLEGKVSDSEAIRETLEAKLPEYMVPSSFTLLDSLPITMNGKLDKSALPEPTLETSDRYVAPSNQIECDLCDVWTRVLAVESVGVTDNFFRMGGESILAILVTTELRKIGYALDVKDIISKPTVAQLAKQIELNRRLALEEGESLNSLDEQGKLSGSLPLNAIQQWFFNQSFDNQNHWNQAFTFSIPNEIDVEALQLALTKVVEQHDILSARFHLEGGEISQTYEASQPLPDIHVLEVGQDHYEDQIALTKLQSHFDVFEGPLWNVALLKNASKQSAQVFLAFHHLIMDAVSWRILTNDIKHLIEGGELGQKGTSYRQWAQVLGEYAQAHPNEKEYWRSTLEDVERLPVAKKVSSQSRLAINNTLTGKLLRGSNQGYHTEINDLLLSALAMALKTVTGHSTQHILLEGHGREAIDKRADVSQTVGWFTSISPLALKAETSIEDTVISTKEAMRSLPNKGAAFSTFYHQSDFGEYALPNVSFNYLGQLSTKGSEEHWAIRPDNAGQTIGDGNHDGTALALNGVVLDDELVFYIDSRLDFDASQRFEKALEDALTCVIEHTDMLGAKGGVKTPSDFNVSSLSIARLRRLQNRFADIEAIHPATHLQRGLVFHSLNHPNDDAYRVQLLLDYTCELDLKTYMKSWILAAETFPILRTSFDWEEGEIIQVVHGSAMLAEEDFEYVDLSAQIPEQQELEIRKIQRLDRQKGFDLSEPKLIRFVVIKLSAQRYTLLKTEHHSICDGWSIPLLLEAVHEYYDANVAGSEIRVKPESTYLDAQAYLSSHQKETDAFWQEKKAQFEQANDISVMFDKKVSLPDVNEIANPQESTIRIDGNAYHQLKKQCLAAGITANVALQFAWHKLIQIFTQDEQTNVGTIVSGRALPIEGIEKSVGLYINTLPLTVNWQAEQSVQHVLNGIQQSISELNTHSNVALSDLQTGGERLFHSIMVFENYPMPEGMTEGIGAHIEFRSSVEKLDYPLVLMAYEHDESLSLVLKYGQDWLCESSSRQLLNLLVGIVNSALVDTELPQKNIVAAPTYQMNESSHGERSEYTLQYWFERHASQSPHAIALESEQQKMTYEEVNNKANALARYIQQWHRDTYQTELKPDTCIALYQDKSTDLVISMLAILKAGGAYVPVSTTYPVERASFILADTDARLILADSHSLSDSEALQARHDNACWVSVNSLELNERLDDNVTCLANSGNLGAIIYTSGTTGNPKGVMIEQHSMVDLVVNANYINIDDRDTFLFLSSPVFDAATLEIWGALANGGKLIIPADTKELASNIERFRSVIKDVSILWVTRSLFDYLYIADKTLFNNLKYLLVGGEALTPKIMKELAASSYRPTHILNGYGPTECTTFTTTYEIEPGIELKTIPIGSAVSNRELHVLDPQLQPLPQGAIGELYIGGTGLARGYLNRPELTEKAFLESPFEQVSGNENQPGRLYKTGDLVRWLPCGNLEYLGRNDCQVKIRGFRIELGEIESTLNQIAGVKQAVVVDLEDDGNKSLAAYIVPIKSGCSMEDVRESLENQLPDYMVPSSFTFIDSIPLTVNGKLDKRALPEPAMVDDDNYLAPRTQIERDLCTVWMQVLELKKVGIKDNFFRIGGDSIQSILVTTELRKLGYVCTTRAIFENKTIESLAKYIADNDAQNDIVSEQGNLEGEFDLLPIQQWFNELELANPNHFNQSFLIQVPNLDESRLNTAIQKLVAQHDALRLRFVTQNGNVVAQEYIKDIHAPAVLRCDLSATQNQIQNLMTQWQSDFDIENGPLWRFVYLDGGDKDSGESKASMIYCAFHHLVVDSVSWRIIVDDLERFYKGEQPQEKGTSYRQWVLAVQDYAENHSSEQDYWLEQVEDQPDYQHHSGVVSDVSKTKVTLDSVRTSKLLSEANQAYKTEINDLLLTALGMSLKNWHGSEDSYITLEGHGRENIGEQFDITQTVGWFTTAFPVKILSQDNMARSIRTNKETLRHIPQKGLGYGALRSFLPTDVNRLQQHPLPKVSFNYLGQFNASQEQKSWSIVNQYSGEEVCGENKSDNVLTVAGRVQDNQLHMDVLGCLEQDQVEQIAHDFIESLEAIIFHCTQTNLRESFTPSDFPNAKISLEELDRIQGNFDIESVYQATGVQRELMYFNRVNPDFQIDQNVTKINGDLSPEILEQAWNFAAQRYDVLRAGFSDRAYAGHPNLFIQKTVTIPFEILDWSDVGNDQLEQKIRDKTLLERNTPFNIECAPLIKLVCIRASQDRHYLIQTFNHILFDGWSVGILNAELMKDYQALKQGKRVSVTPLSFEPFPEYLLNTFDRDGAKTFWDDYLKGAPLNQRLPFSNEKPIDTHVEKRMKGIGGQLSQEQTRKLYQFAESSGYTPNQITQLAWCTTLAEFLSTEDICIGTTMSDRPAEIDNVQSLFGLFVASPVLRVKGVSNKPVEKHLDDIALSQLDRQQYAFHELNHYDEHWVPTSPFGSLFVFENMPDGETDETPPFEYEVVDVVSGSNHQTVLCLVPTPENLMLKLFFDSSELSKHHVQEVFDRFVMVVELLTESQDVLSKSLKHVVEGRKALAL
ncbi:Putative ANTIBIOTIC SYNTHETASE [Vibrio nigripulchritudo SFn27]|nr:non-ribosomal peptide synthetase [Vibrio nigripulchritudo]CCN80747.1 Putative ANTIBIOTIC SYNTHETASE [Vibrio nigripulchritudo BLFn1]CCN87841.1 Putative ANTIBIOTIC SYNTHETASE [Vibrio nigripulchritudo SFn27]CCO43101.1 Putative ANTIBIOTIC SYNTHETASE [Vibrio nigripulchritudo SFn135]CCO52524.1 Putative ANTIBIOTIC SYNTHETASE [Vibrio nigripulchritudo Wn13]